MMDNGRQGKGARGGNTERLRYKMLIRTRRGRLAYEVEFEGVSI
jgi:hypothetical protein